MEKWKSQLNVEIIKEARPHTLWKICGKKVNLWKKTDKEIVFRIFHRQHFTQPVEKWKTVFNCLKAVSIFNYSGFNACGKFP
ncbi:MAG: hypothetical protein ABIP06_01375 [Pyrinomonadaceae bacterium]